MGFRTSDVNKFKKGHFIMINGSILQEEITLNATNMLHCQNTWNKLIELKEYTEKSIIIGHFNIDKSNWWDKYKKYQEGYRCVYITL